MATMLSTRTKSELNAAAAQIIEGWDGETSLTVRGDKGSAGLRLVSFTSGDEPDASAT